MLTNDPLICDIYHVKKEGNMVSDLGTNLAFITKDNGFSKLQSLLKHITLLAKLQE
jgi:hypothetical protein